MNICNKTVYSGEPETNRAEMTNNQTDDDYYLASIKAKKILPSKISLYGP